MSSRKSRSAGLISPELARNLTEISLEIQRQVGVLIDRRGQIPVTIVGDARSVYLPDLSAYRLGGDRLCGLRLVHSHLHGGGLDDDDLTDLALLRLDFVAAVDVESDGLPGAVHAAHLLPNNAAGAAWEILPSQRVHDLAQDFSAVITALEEEFARNRAPRKAGDRRVRALIVHVSQRNRTEAEESVEELRELSLSAGIDVVHTILQRRSPDPKRVLGKGKLQDALVKSLQLGAEVIVFDMNLSPAQVKNLADFTDLKILDRTQVILDIFAQRAETREGKTQVELAQLRYLLPRLSAKHTAMSRLTGGIGGRGPGETKLEIDRRRAQRRITDLQNELKRLGNRRRLRRHVRSEKGVPTVSIVGYTNAGKSTLLNQLTNSRVVAEDALFATLNPVSRRLRFPHEREVIVTDTVGFIRDLPGELMEAFKTTFEEIEPARLLLHVLDASSPNVEDHFATVKALLGELDFEQKRTLVVLNKVDRCEASVVRGLVAKYDGVAVCAKDSSSFGPLLREMERGLWPGVAVDADAGDAVAGEVRVESSRRDVV